MSRAQLLSPKSQAGQAIVLIAFMIIVLFGAVGLAVDGGIAYYYNSAAERAAASAALAGVIFMPNQLAPCCAGNDATDRALQAATRNGFPNGGANNVQVTVSRYTDPVTGKIQDESLQVTVSRDVNTFFMQLFGISKITVSRTAVAQYLKPLKLGEPCLFPPSGTGDCHTGSTVSQLGTTGFYFLRTEGWATDRGQGDAYTPSQNAAGCGPACPSNDVHSIAAAPSGTDVADATLPGPGGYNFILTVPTGFTAQLQVYNAVFGADSNISGPNFCENWLQTKPAGYKCSPGGNYSMHEHDTAPYGNPGLYSAMQYTILNAPSAFIRTSDTIMSQMVVKPVDASNWNIAPPNAPTYDDINNPGKTITQQFNAATGAPTNMFAYHSWMNVGGYVPNATCAPPVIGAVGIPCVGSAESESAIISYRPGRGPIGALPAGTYRLRIDTLNSDGSIPPGNSQAHKGLAVRVMDGANGNVVCGNSVTPCSLSALDDLAIFTPMTVPGGSTFRMPIFSVPAIYAGLTIGVDIFDGGDMGGTGSIYIGFVDPTTCNLFTEPLGGATANVYDIGNQRSNLGTGAQVSIGAYANPNPVEQVFNSAGNPVGDNKWYHFDIPIPSTYAPVAGGTACDPTGQGYWSLQYRTTNNVTSVDTITITLNLRGNPAHILKS